MLVTQTPQKRVDEINRCRDRSWLSLEDEQRFGITNPVDIGEWVGIKHAAPAAQFNGLISIGQKVFLPGEQLIGLTTKLFLNPQGQVSHLAIRIARLFGQHKLVPIAFVSDVTPLRVLLTIPQEQFMELPEYQNDSSIAEEVDRALWKDVVLRETDYHEIDVQVRDGIITLHGHVLTGMNQWRAETAVKNIPNIMGLKSYLIPDDKLMMQVAEALGQIEQDSGSRFFTKVENGVVVLIGEVSSPSLRDQAEQCVAEIPWVRGVINEIHAPGIVLNPEEQRFLQPYIGKELLFKDAHSVTIRKVVINPRNRRVVAVIVLGQFPDPIRKDTHSDDRGKRSPERLVVLPVNLILYLTRSAGFLRINSDEITQFADFDLSCHSTPVLDWTPPYPYCNDEVLFLADERSALA